MSQDGAMPLRPPGRPRERVAYSEALARTICARLAAGEVLYRLCREPGMPTPEAVAKWARNRPGFGKALEAARRMGGRPANTRGGVSTYCRETGEAIFERLCQGESLTRIGADPTMPSLSTIFYWRRRIPEFEDAVQMGKAIQAERFSDLGMELAMGATPETAYLTHVRLAHLRWMAGVMAPRVYRLKPTEPQTPRETLDVVVRRFCVEVDEATGARSVAAWRADPATGAVVREAD